MIKYLLNNCVIWQTRLTAIKYSTVIRLILYLLYRLSLRSLLTRVRVSSLYKFITNDSSFLWVLLIQWLWWWYNENSNIRIGPIAPDATYGSWIINVHTTIHIRTRVYYIQYYYIHRDTVKNDFRLMFFFCFVFLFFSFSYIVFTRYAVDRRIYTRKENEVTPYPLPAIPLPSHRYHITKGVWDGRRRELLSFSY